MVSVQRSIEIRVPVHMLYEQLTQFESYPQFMHDIESVEKSDPTHLHWKARMTEQPVEWDAAITECIPDRCIAWQSESGPRNAGKVEMQAVGPAASRLTFTLVSEMEIEPTTPAGDIKAELSERVWEDLASLRSLLESRQQDSGGAQSRLHSTAFAGQETGPVAETGIAQGTGRVGNAAGREGIDEVATLGSIEGMAQGDADTGSGSGAPQRAVDSLARDRGSPGNPVPSSGLTAERLPNGNMPMAQASQRADQYHHATENRMDGANMNAPELQRGQQGNATQADYSLSKGSGSGFEGGRDAIAEEVSFDQQSDAARHVGHLPGDDDNEMGRGIPNAEVIAKAMQRRPPEPEF